MRDVKAKRAQTLQEQADELRTAIRQWIGHWEGTRTARSASVLEPKFGDKYSWRGARIARREERVYWA